MVVRSLGVSYGLCIFLFFEYSVQCTVNAFFRPLSKIAAFRFLRAMLLFCWFCNLTRCDMIS